PVVATEITMLIPLSVILLPFIDVAITGTEKSIWKRPVILMTAIMGFVNWIVFSILIIVNIANIHNDPPYWRCFMFLMIDIGMMLQLVVLARNPDVKQRVKNASGAAAMGVVAAIQSVWALWYYFMACTEQFLDPILQAFTYYVFRPFEGSFAAQSEQVVRT